MKKVAEEQQSHMLPRGVFTLQEKHPHFGYLFPLEQIEVFTGLSDKILHSWQAGMPFQLEGTGAELQKLTKMAESLAQASGMRIERIDGTKRDVASLHMLLRAILTKEEQGQATDNILAHKKKLQEELFALDSSYKQRIEQISEQQQHLLEQTLPEGQRTNIAIDAHLKIKEFTALARQQESRLQEIETKKTLYVIRHLGAFSHLEQSVLLHYLSGEGTIDNVQQLRRFEPLPAALLVHDVQADVRATALAEQYLINRGTKGKKETTTQPHALKARSEGTITSPLARLRHIGMGGFNDFFFGVSELGLYGDRISAPHYRLIVRLHRMMTAYTVMHPNATEEEIQTWMYTQAPLLLSDQYPGNIPKDAQKLCKEVLDMATEHCVRVSMVKDHYIKDLKRLQLLGDDQAIGKQLFQHRKTAKETPKKPNTFKKILGTVKRSQAKPTPLQKMTQKEVQDLIRMFLMEGRTAMTSNALMGEIRPEDRQLREKLREVAPMEYLHSLQGTSAAGQTVQKALEDMIAAVEEHYTVQVNRRNPLSEEALKVEQLKRLESSPDFFQSIITFMKSMRGTGFEGNAQLRETILTYFTESRANMLPQDLASRLTKEVKDRAQTPAEGEKSTPTFASTIASMQLNVAAMSAGHIRSAIRDLPESWDVWGRWMEPLFDDESLVFGAMSKKDRGIFARHLQVQVDFMTLYFYSMVGDTSANTALQKKAYFVDENEFWEKVSTTWDTTLSLINQKRALEDFDPISPKMLSVVLREQLMMVYEILLVQTFQGQSFTEGNIPAIIQTFLTKRSGSPEMMRSLDGITLTQ